MENKYNIKSGDYVSILAPMVQKLKLSGNNLLVFALIHGYSKDDEHTFHGSINYISCWLNISRNAVIDTLKVLVDSNYITKKEFFKNSVKFCEYKSNYEYLIKKLDSGCEIALPVAKTRKGSAKTALGSAEMQPNIDIYIDKDIDSKEKKDTNVSKESDVDDLNTKAEELYKLYPTKCPKRNASLGKSSKDKTKLVKLMKCKDTPYEMIKFTIKAEIEEKYGKQYMSNFSTFLNNLPDYGYTKEDVEEKKENIANNEVVFNGKVYR